MSNKTPFERSVQYLNNNRFDKALPLLKESLREFECKEVLLNLGNCYKANKDYAKAFEYYSKASDPSIPLSDHTFTPVYSIALNNMGQIAYSYEADDAAISYYKEALSAAPNYHTCIFNLSNATLRKLCSRKPVDAALAWKYYTYRFKDKTAIKNDKKDLISWNGIDKVKSIVVLIEQGIGDFFMFARYIERLEEFADKIWVQCPDSVKPLIKYNTCTHVSETDATHGVPIGNLAGIFWQGIPDGRWLADKYVPKEPNGILDIGVTWSGNKRHTNDKNRSVSSGYFAALAKYGNLYTLNPTEHGTKGFTALKGRGWVDDIENLKKLDLVITVDTSIAHFCGCLGMECWVLMPSMETDFRWGDSSMGFDNVWYPSVKVFRNNNNWEDVFKLVGIMLDEKRSK